jgi:glycosyltransferase involved in cell wall biosynthesis
VAYKTLTGHVPYFVFPHGMLDPWFNEQFHLKHMKKMVYWHLLGRRALDSAASLLFTTNEELQRSALAFFPYRWNALISPLGIEEPPLSSTLSEEPRIGAKWPALQGKRYLLFFGRLHPKKGCDLLLRSFAEIREQEPDLQLVMAGPSEPDYLEKLQLLARDLQIERRVVWTGMVTGHLKWELLRQAETFVLPSHQENFAIAAVEALAVGTPALLSDKVQIWHDVKSEGAGLIEPDTLEGTQRLVRRWVCLPESERRQMSMNAFTCYERRFTAEMFGRRVLEQIQTRISQLNDPRPTTALELVGD